MFILYEFMVFMQKKELGKKPPRSDMFLFTHTTNHDGKTFPKGKDKRIFVSFSALA